ncbi:YebC/PmpR family DNA-binding transcriptional regulator [Spiroplasma endosymbiont of Aspidapion aeneum]|uniref:YebC/PmpR family DNA-binding transcriptional regulator n=1 Tax=Spiroplasma endosymbiont of Aspidapion aeneum TaxID=3066276 RepID=UPI00313BC991
MGRAHEVRKASMEKTAALKSALYGRAAREIYMAAKGGSSDPNSNLVLRSAMDKAKSNHIPADVIARAIKKAEGGEVENYIFNRYEGYGPGNSMIVVDSLTSNVNRAIAEIRDVFNKNGGKIAQAGAVSHSFIPCSIFAFEGHTVDEIVDLLLEVDVEIIDITLEYDQTVVYGGFSSFNAIKKVLDNFGILEYFQAETTLKPNEEIILDDNDVKAQFEKLIDKLNELEDVQEVYHNVEL